MILKYYAIFMEHKAKEVKKRSMEPYNQLLLGLGEFQSLTGNVLTFKSIDMEFYREYCRFLSYKKGLAANTIGKHIKNLKTFMNWSHEEGLHNNKAYKKFRVLQRYCEEVCLSSSN